MLSYNVPDMYFLRRFLRARQHDLKRAKEMYTASMKWRREFGVEDVTNNFHFTERDAFIALYPQGYHKTDKLVRCPGVKPSLTQKCTNG